MTCSYKNIVKMTFKAAQTQKATMVGIIKAANVHLMLFVSR